MLNSDSNLQALNFELKTTLNETVSLRSSQKTILYFFAPWCHVCHASIDNVQKVYEKNPDVNVIAIALDYMEEEEIQAFVAKHQLTFPVAFGHEGVKQAFNIQGYPSYYVIDEENTIVYRSTGYSTELGLHLRLY